MFTVQAIKLERIVTLQMQSHDYFKQFCWEYQGERTILEIHTLKYL